MADVLESNAIQALADAARTDGFRAARSSDFYFRTVYDDNAAGDPALSTTMILQGRFYVAVLSNATGVARVSAVLARPPDVPAPVGLVLAASASAPRTYALGEFAKAPLAPCPGVKAAFAGTGLPDTVWPAFSKALSWCGFAALKFLLTV